MSVSGDTPEGPSLAVGLCTYKRPAGLKRVLDHIAPAARSTGRAVQVVVVDNDGADPSVAEIAASFGEASGLKTHYVVETRPGISAARNAVFERMEALGVRFVAMLDDDEWPSSEWLVELLRVQAAEDVAVVGGPVVPVFPVNRGRLQAIARYWSVLPQKLNGKVLVFCTCNFLIDMHALVDRPRPLFDDRFGLSGGGDTVFFRGLFFAGLQMAWADGAIVHEEVPSSRASLKWMRTRRFRTGNHAAQWEMLEQGPVRPFVKTLALTVRLIFYPLLGREPESRLVGWLLEVEKVRGRYVAHAGSRFIEYARGRAASTEASTPTDWAPR